MNPVENNRVFLFQHLHHQFLATEADALPISLGFPDSLQMTQLGNALKLAAELIVKCNGHHTDRPSMSQHLWYVRRNGEKSGPFPAGQLREMFSLGQLDLKDEVSLDDHAWVTLRDTDILAAEPKHQSPTEYDDEVWRLEREKAKLRWISDSVEVASGEGKGPVTDESVARLRRHEAETRVLVDAQSKKRPAFVAGLISVLVLLLIGFGFKVAAVPFHMWTPDVYEGAPAPVTAFVATVSKGSMFALLLRYFTQANVHASNGLFLALSLVAIASMFAGNLLALLQNNIKRLLAYSSIAHMGYLLVALLASGPLAFAAVAFYLVAYFVTTLGAFAVVTALSDSKRDADRLHDYQGLFWNRPWLAAIFTIALLSLAGIPLTAGFVGKFYVVAAGAGSALWLLVIVLVVNSAIGLFYYLRVVVAMCMRAPEPESGAVSAFALPLSWIDRIVLAALVLLVLWLGIYPALLLELIQKTLPALS